MSEPGCFWFWMVSEILALEETGSVSCFYSQMFFTVGSINCRFGPDGEQDGWFQIRGSETVLRRF